MGSVTHHVQLHLWYPDRLGDIQESILDMDTVFRTRFKARHLHLGTGDNAVLLCESARLPPGHDPLVNINLVAQKHKGKIGVAVANAGLV